MRTSTKRWTRSDSRSSSSQRGSSARPEVSVLKPLWARKLACGMKAVWIRKAKATSHIVNFRSIRKGHTCFNNQVQTTISEQIRLARYSNRCHSLKSSRGPKSIVNEAWTSRMVTVSINQFRQVATRAYLPLALEEHPGPEMGMQTGGWRIRIILPRLRAIKKSYRTLDKRWKTKFEQRYYFKLIETQIY